MPTYVFQCKSKKCNKRYQDMVRYDETGKYASVKCPFCKSKKKEQIIIACNFNFSNPEGTDRWTSDSTGHDYRFKHKEPKVKKERENAAKASHVGPQPYNPIDDISQGNVFGEVK